MEQVNITAKEYSFEMSPQRVTAGLVAFRLKNVDKDQHAAQVARLNDGVTPDQVVRQRECAIGQTTHRSGSRKALEICRPERGHGIR